MEILPGHVPPGVDGLTPTGRLPATQQLRLAMGLPLHNVGELNDFLARVYDPASSDFHHYLTLEEFTARFGPTEQDYEAVKAFARTNGLAVAATYGNRLVLDVTGPVAAVEQALHLTLRTYRHPTEARDFFAPDTDPAVPAELPAVDVQGLSNYSRPRPKLHRREAAARSRAQANGGTAPDGSGNYFGNDFRNAYAPGTTLTGAGQELGLLEADGFYASDISTYAVAAGNGRASIPIQTVLLDSFSGTPTTGSSSGNPEVSLDIEMAMSMAPGLAQIVVYEGNPNDFIPNDILNSMLSSNAMVKNLSSSWGWSGGPSKTTATIFTNMAAVGQSFFNAAGDSDAFTTGASSANGVDNPSLGNNPSSCPMITQVGGTTLTTGGSAAYGSEEVWNWNYVTAEQKYVGSSGGISSYYSIPSWQTNFNMAARGGSASYRNIPDVALTADNVYVTYGNGSRGEFGGTSCAAPLWAAFVSLVNEQAVDNGKPVMGFVNPVLYSLAAGGNDAACFHDVTVGSNCWSGSTSLFYATNGYDLCTGLGTPNGVGLINALAGWPGLVVTPSSSSATGLAGGPFSVANGAFELTNASTSPLTWSLVNSAAWLDIAPTNGTLAAGAQTRLPVSLTSTAATLGAGTYTATLMFSNATAQAAQSAWFTLEVNQPMLVSPTNGFAATGPAGGAFNVASQSCSLTNQSLSALSWGLINPSSWLSVSPVNGTLAGGAQTEVTVSLTTAADGLTVGSYTAFVQVTNATGLVASLPVTLQVKQPMLVSPTNGFAAAGPVGGVFNVTSQTYLLTNQSVSSGSWSLINTSSWLSVSPSGGTLAGGAQATLTVGLSGGASSLVAGDYAASVLVSNAAGLAVSLPFSLAVGQSIISNGGFETGSFSGWTVVGDTIVGRGRHETVYDAVESAASGYSVIHAGTFGAFMGDDQLATLSQTVSTTAGQNYLLSLWLNNPASGATQIFEVNWGGAMVYSVTNPPAFSWTNLQFIVTATGTATRLQFGVQNDPSYFGLDDISLALISAPAFNRVQDPPQNSASFNLTWSAVPGLNYQVQYNTNLAQTNWLNLGGVITAATNTLTLSDTNALLNSPQRFYRLLELP